MARTSGQSSSLVGRLLAAVRKAFGVIPDHRQIEKNKITLVDALMSAVALFSLKFPSLLKFDEKRTEKQIRYNLQHLYGVLSAPCDTQMREILDPVAPEALHGAYREVFSIVEEKGLLAPYHFLGDHLLVSIDGTGQFASSKLSCPSCANKTTRGGETLFYHQLLGAAIVHPNQRQVIPLIPEPILGGDGDTKNDCERNAAKRLLPRLHADYPKHNFIILEDALASNGPHLNLLKELGFHYIIGVKEGDHAHLFEKVRAHEEDETMEGRVVSEENGKIVRVYRFVNDLALNKSHPDLKVNFLEYIEIRAGKEPLRFTWVTDLLITEENCIQIALGGRTRWKIENETFNTLKNQGYHFEHNFGHGEQHLATNFALLMMLAFLIDQVQELGCLLFQKARRRFRSRTSLWEQLRALFIGYFIDTWEILWRSIANGHSAARLEPQPNDTS
jgi:hypothetical protein